MKVLVNKNHIQLGRKGFRDSCPIALALKGAGCSNVSVGGKEYSYSINGKTKKGELPSIAQRFVSRFDSGKKVNQIMFVLPK